MTVALFATLLVAGLSSYCFKTDFIWYNSLEKPAFVLSSGYWSSFVVVSYLSGILSITRLVEHKHIFPSMIFFAVLGVFVILFVYAFFTLKHVLLAFVFITIVLAFAYILFVRFLTKDVTLAVIFLPILLFNVYAFISTLAILMAN
ncbi:MAG: tryptophan-rich sensory protein [Clostridia bacterium]|nr:tryptophan-rich sensory protein [Clostridia bacterium]